MARVGIYSGVFDPVHEGHVQFALAAAKAAKLDKVYFLVEAQPRHKAGVTHLAHRQAMIKITIKNHTNLSLLDLPDRQFSVSKTLPRLNHKFPSDQLFFMIGSDLLEYIGEWPLIDRLLTRLGLIVGLRARFTLARAKKLIEQLPFTSDQVFVIKSPAAKLSSSAIRESLLSGKDSNSLDAEVLDYIKANWLYASPSNSSSAS